MAEPIKISTSKYSTHGKAEVDGKIWNVKLPGAATDMRLSQLENRITLLEKKVATGEFTEEDLDKLEGYSKEMFDTFKSMFSDGTPENTEVEEWFNSTPLSVIIMAINDLKEQANGRADTPSST